MRDHPVRFIVPPPYEGILAHFFIPAHMLARSAQNVETPACQKRRGCPCRCPLAFTHTRVRISYIWIELAASACDICGTSHFASSSPAWSTWWTLPSPHGASTRPACMESHRLGNIRPARRAPCYTSGRCSGAVCTAEHVIAAFSLNIRADIGRRNQARACMR